LSHFAMPVANHTVDASSPSLQSKPPLQLTLFLALPYNRRFRTHIGRIHGA
jgi:hypothetical protein